MLWFSVWAVLVVATLVGAFVLGRSLYRSGRALLAEIVRAGEVLGQVADRADGRAGAAVTVPAPVSLTDPEPARARRTATIALREQRRARQAAAHAAVHQRWRSFSH